MDEMQLISGLRACSAAAHEALYDEYAGDLHDYCHALLGDDAAAVAALRETLLRAAASTDSMPPGCGLRAWLYALARGQCRSGGERLIEHAMPDDDPSARLLVSVLGTLTGRDREVLELTGRHRLSEEELEPVLGLPADRVGSLVADARRRFDQAMAEELDRTGPVEYPALAEITDDGGTDPLPLLFRALPRVPLPTGQRPRILDDLLIAGTTGTVPAAFTAEFAATPPHGTPASADESAEAAGAAHGRPRAKRGRGLLVGGAAVAAVVVVAGAVFAVVQSSDSRADQGNTAGAPASTAPPTVDPTHLPSAHRTRGTGDVKRHGHHHGSATPDPSQTGGRSHRKGDGARRGKGDGGSTPSTAPTSGGHPGTSRPPATHRPPTHRPTHRPTHHPTPPDSPTPTPTATPTQTDVTDSASPTG